MLGLIAAALGVTREDQGAHDALDRGYGFGVRLDAPGAPLVDYHTAQTVGASAVKKQRPATRAALLAAGERETILSRRAYRQDALATVALWVRDPDARWSLAALHTALGRPGFTLYAGRKANVFGLPLGPVVRECATLAEAVAWYADSRGMRADAPAADVAAVRGVLNRLRPRQGWGRELAFDDPGGAAEAGVATDRREVRRDVRAQRARWQFAERVVHVGTVPTATGGSSPGVEVEP